jgi:hypothetical protein
MNAEKRDSPCPQRSVSHGLERLSGAGCADTERGAQNDDLAYRNPILMVLRDTWEELNGDEGWD